MNILSSCRSQGNQQLALCPFCRDEPESVSHFILKCDKYRDIRSNFFDKLVVQNAQVNLLNDQEMLRYILNVECPDKLIGMCCNFLCTLYDQRVKDNITLCS